MGGGSDRIEEADPRYKYAGGFPSQWWSDGHAKRSDAARPAHSFGHGRRRGPDRGSVAFDANENVVHHLKFPWSVTSIALMK